MTYFFKGKFNLPEGQLGTIFFTTNLISAASMLVASSLAKRIGNVKVRLFLAKWSQSLILAIDHGVHTLALGHLPGADRSPIYPSHGTHLLGLARLFSEHGCGTSLRIPCRRFAG
jgi:hypothetical protein